MAIRKRKPTSAGRRFQTVSDFSEVTRTTPERTLVVPLPHKAGRNAYGRKTSATRVAVTSASTGSSTSSGSRTASPAKVAAIEYDPNRTCRIALLHYATARRPTSWPPRA